MSIGSTNIKAREREQLNKDIQVFLANGGKIEKLPYLTETINTKNKKGKADA